MAEHSENENDWIAAQRRALENYLDQEEIDHCRVPPYPAFHAIPHLALWAVASKNSSPQVKLWVVTGNLPTSYHIQAGETSDVGAALREFSQRFRHVAAFSRREGLDLDPRIPTPYEPKIAARFDEAAEMLLRCADGKERNQKAEPSAAPNGGPGMSFGNSDVSEGPPSVS